MAVRVLTQKVLGYLVGSVGVGQDGVVARALGLNTAQLEMQNAMKNFRVTYAGSDLLGSWFFETLSVMLGCLFYRRFGTKLKNGVTRYTSNTNGGPVFVYVKDGKILRITPIDFDGKDPEPWTVEARGRSFSPPHKSTISPHAQAWKSMVYSEDRLLYPLKRVDFDPDGAPGSTGPGGPQRPEPRHLGLRAHQLGRGPGHRSPARSSA